MRYRYALFRFAHASGTLLLWWIVWAAVLAVAREAVLPYAACVVIASRVARLCTGLHSIYGLAESLFDLIAVTMSLAWWALNDRRMLGSPPLLASLFLIHGNQFHKRAQTLLFRWWVLPTAERAVQCHIGRAGNSYVAAHIVTYQRSLATNEPEAANARQARQVSVLPGPRACTSCGKWNLDLDLDLDPSPSKQDGALWFPARRGHVIHAVATYVPPGVDEFLADFDAPTAEPCAHDGMRENANVGVRCAEQWSNSRVIYGKNPPGRWVLGRAAWCKPPILQFFPTTLCAHESAQVSRDGRFALVVDNQRLALLEAASCVHRIGSMETTGPELSATPKSMHLPIRDADVEKGVVHQGWIPLHPDSLACKYPGWIARWIHALPPLRATRLAVEDASAEKTVLVHVLYITETREPAVATYTAMTFVFPQTQGGNS
jgi:hypothetical protein